MNALKFLNDLAGFPNWGQSFSRIRFQYVYVFKALFIVVYATVIAFSMYAPIERAMYSKLTLLLNDNWSTNVLLCCTFCFQIEQCFWLFSYEISCFCNDLLILFFWCYFYRFIGGLRTVVSVSGFGDLPVNTISFQLSSLSSTLLWHDNTLAPLHHRHLSF